MCVCAGGKGGGQKRFTVYGLDNMGKERPPLLLIKIVRGIKCLHKHRLVTNRDKRERDRKKERGMSEKMRRGKR